MLLWTPDQRKFCGAVFGSDEDKAVLWWTVALLGFLDLLPCPAALMVPHRLPVEQSFSATTVTAHKVYGFHTTTCVVSHIYIYFHLILNVTVIWG